jgi:hypothetical protein
MRKPLNQKSSEQRWSCGYAVSQTCEPTHQQPAFEAEFSFSPHCRRAGVPGLQKCVCAGRVAEGNRQSRGGGVRLWVEL